MHVIFVHIFYIVGPESVRWEWPRWR